MTFLQTASCCGMTHSEILFFLQGCCMGAVIMCGIFGYRDTKKP